MEALSTYNFSVCLMRQSPISRHMEKNNPLCNIKFNKITKIFILTIFLSIYIRKSKMTKFFIEAFSFEQLPYIIMYKLWRGQSLILSINILQNISYIYIYYTHTYMHTHTHTYIYTHTHEKNGNKSNGT